MGFKDDYKTVWLSNNSFELITTVCEIKIWKRQIVMTVFYELQWDICGSCHTIFNNNEWLYLYEWLQL